MIYLDHNATTPIAPEAARAMMPFLEEEFGNPSNDYDLGQRAKSALENARSQVAVLLGADSSEILFTSGGTESNNTVLKGLFHKSGAPFHIITSRIEHPAIINPALFLMTLGVDVTFVHSSPDGLVDPDEIRAAIKPETTLVSIMLANNETGVLQPLEEISAITRDKGVLLHTDAAQAVGKIPVDVNRLAVDFLSVAGHKLYAPKGVGALYIRKGLSLEPLLHGAGQESGRRAGTENVLLAVGLGAACALAQKRLPNDGPEVAILRDRLYEKLKAGLPELVLVGCKDKRLPNTLNISLPGLIGSEILTLASKVRASTGAACHAGTVKASPILQAMGLDDRTAAGAVRLSLGRSNTTDQIDEAARDIIEAARKLMASGKAK